MFSIAPQRGSRQIRSPLSHTMCFSYLRRPERCTPLAGLRCKGVKATIATLRCAARGSSHDASPPPRLRNACPGKLRLQRRRVAARRPSAQIAHGARDIVPCSPTTPPPTKQEQISSTRGPQGLLPCHSCTNRAREPCGSTRLVGRDASRLDRSRPKTRVYWYSYQHSYSHS